VSTQLTVLDHLVEFRLGGLERGLAVVLSVEEEVRQPQRAAVCLGLELGLGWGSG
jgi:hypothetical protein